MGKGSIVLVLLAMLTACGAGSPDGELEDPNSPCQGWYADMTSEQCKKPPVAGPVIPEPTPEQSLLTRSPGR